LFSHSQALARSAEIARSKDAPAAPLGTAPNDTGDILEHRLIVASFIGGCDLALQVAPHCFGPAIGTGDPGGGARIDPAVERLVALT
jgi:hypothetical protein